MASPRGDNSADNTAAASSSSSSPSASPAIDHAATNPQQPSGSQAPRSSGPLDPVDWLIIQASMHYGANKPCFCIHWRQDTKTVKMAGDDGDLTDLVWKEWSGVPGGGNAWEGRIGFWILTDKNNQRHIVKYDKGKYYAWKGVMQRFDEEPVAVPAKDGEVAAARGARGGTRTLRPR